MPSRHLPMAFAWGTDPTYYLQRFGSITMKRRTIILVLVVAVFALADGCARVEKEKKAQGLEAATNGYGKSIRWAYYEAAYGYLHPDLRKAEVPKKLENVRVTAYEIVQPPTMRNDSQTKAEQVAQIEYILRDEQVVRKVSNRQDWRYDSETETWWLHSSLPDFD